MDISNEPLSKLENESTESHPQTGAFNDEDGKLPSSSLGKRKRSQDDTGEEEEDSECTIETPKASSPSPLQQEDHETTSPGTLENDSDHDTPSYATSQTYKQDALLLEPEPSSSPHLKTFEYPDPVYPPTPQKTEKGVNENEKKQNEDQEGEGKQETPWNERLYRRYSDTSNSPKIYTAKGIECGGLFIDIETGESLSVAICTPGRPWDGVSEEERKVMTEEMERALNMPLPNEDDDDF